MGSCSAVYIELECLAGTKEEGYKPHSIQIQALVHFFPRNCPETAGEQVSELLHVYVFTVGLLVSAVTLSPTFGTPSEPDNRVWQVWQQRSIANGFPGQRLFTLIPEALCPAGLLALALPLCTSQRAYSRIQRPANSFSRQEGASAAAEEPRRARSLQQQYSNVYDACPAQRYIYSGPTMDSIFDALTVDEFESTAAFVVWSLFRMVTRPCTGTPNRLAEFQVF